MAIIIGAARLGGGNAGKMLRTLSLTILLTALLCRAASAFVFVRQEVSIPMRDGKYLAADVHLPDTSGTWPVVLIQTPYNRKAFRAVFQSHLSSDPLLKDADYAFVVLDWRGFGDSKDAEVSVPHYGQDGYDAVEWIADQAWCDGNVGTWGASALGLVQFRTAAERPPALKACVPIVAQYRTWYDEYYTGCVYCENVNGFISEYFTVGSFVTDHPLNDDSWAAIEEASGDVGLIDVPMLHISGWYDHHPDISIREMMDIQTGGGTNARGRQKMLIGPWSHSHVGQSVQGELEYPSAEDESSRAAVEFFDRYLRGIANGYEEHPIFRYFVMNEDRWASSAVWPPSPTENVTLYLDGEGGLVEEFPSGAADALSYLSDPLDPAPTLFGAILVETSATQGPGDLSPFEARPDVLEFTTAPFSRPLTVAGDVRAYIWIACSAVDTDVSVRMTQVNPDGKSNLLVDSIRRASLRDSDSTKTLLSSGAPYEVRVDLPPVAVTIPSGSRLRLDISSSNYDRFAVNPQDGHDFRDQAGANPASATVSVLVNSSHPSRVVLPTPGSSGVALWQAY